MSGLVKLEYDRSLLQAVGKAWLIGLAGSVLMVAFPALTTGHFTVLSDHEFWVTGYRLILPILLIIFLPLSFATFIRPCSQSRTDLIVHCGLVLIIAGLIFATIVYYISGRDFVYILIFIPLFFFINILMYLPSILKEPEAKS